MPSTHCQAYCTHSAAPALIRFTSKLQAHGPGPPPGAAQHAGQVVQDGITLALVLKQLHVGVEEVTLGDVDALGAQLVYQAQDAGGDGGLPVVV
jgi:hypothetical protein